ncbi:alpha/beta fold hydrolase [Catenulispora subtropica]
MTAHEVKTSEFKTTAAADRYRAAYQQTFDRVWPVPATPLDVPTAYGTTRVHRCGSQDGTPIVLLPASGGNALMWHRYIEPLSREHAVYAVDTVGEPGLSVQTAPLADGRDLADWLDQTLDGLDLAGVHIVGASYGGWVALSHQVHHPGRAAGLTLVDSAGFAEVGFRFYLWLIGGGLAGLALRPLRPRLARIVHNSAILDDDLMGLMKASMGFRRRLPAATVFSDEELERIRVPAQFLLGASSALHRSGQVADHLHRVLPAAQVEIVPGTGHALSTDEPALVLDRILQAAAPARADAAEA